MRNRSIKCIALDLDGTLLNSQGTLSEVNRDALMKAMEQGMHVVIASGRPFTSLPQEMLEIEGIEYAITSNGAAVYHVPSGEKVHGYLLETASVEQILSLTKQEPIVYEAFVNGLAHADERYVNDPVKYGAKEEAIDYIQRTRIKEKDMLAFIREHQDVLDSVDIIVSSLEQKKRIVQLLEMVDGIYITSSVVQLVEIAHKDAGKHSGLKFLAKKLGFHTDEIIAFGNDDNDIDMLECAGYGVAVANASEGCLEVADVVTKSHDEHGVAEVICKMF